MNVPCPLVPVMSHREGLALFPGHLQDAGRSQPASLLSLLLLSQPLHLSQGTELGVPWCCTDDPGQEPHPAQGAACPSLLSRTFSGTFPQFLSLGSYSAPCSPACLKPGVILMMSTRFVLTAFWGSGTRLCHSHPPSPWVSLTSRQGCNFLLIQPSHELWDQPQC